MVVQTIVLIDEDGQLTLPEEARQALHLAGQAQLVMEIVEDSVVLRPVVEADADDEDDSWAYTPENRRLLEQALADAREGRILRISKGELERLVLGHE